MVSVVSVVRTSAETEGLLLIDKPAGITSHDVVQIVRRAYGERSIGHLGTLDPFATGLLILLLGRSTRLANFIVTEGENARAEDALALAEEIRERVRREQGIELEYEVELWQANPSRDYTEEKSAETADGSEERSGEL